MRTDGQTYRHDEATSRFARFYNRACKPRLNPISEFSRADCCIRAKSWWTSRFNFKITAAVYTETPFGRIQNTSRLDPPPQTEGRDFTKTSTCMILVHRFNFCHPEVFNTYNDVSVKHNKTLLCLLLY